jgi:hypothetical protein
MHAPAYACALWFVANYMYTFSWSARKLVSGGFTGLRCSHVSASCARARAGTWLRRGVDLLVRG